MPIPRGYINLFLAPALARLPAPGAAGATLIFLYGTTAALMGATPILAAIQAFTSPLPFATSALPGNDCSAFFRRSLGISRGSDLSLRLSLGLSWNGYHGRGGKGQDKSEEVGELHLVAGRKK